MILIHIVLGLLKIIGILLLVVLALLLFMILSVLFVPVRYQAYGYRDSKVSKGTVRVFWLARLISCKASYDSQEKKTKWSVRIFGISIQKVMTWKNKRKRTKQNTRQEKTQTKDTKRKETQRKEIQQIEETSTKEKLINEKPIKETQKKETETVLNSEKKVKKAKNVEQKPDKVERIESEAESKKKADKYSLTSTLFKKFQKILEIPKKILQKIKKIRLTVRGICDKISEIRTFLESEVFLNAKTLLFGEAKKLGLHILPGKVEGEIEFGFEDPSLTGRVLAVAGICYPLYGNSIKITPYFDREILEGKIKLKGRIRGIVLLKSALKIGFNQEIREIWKNFNRIK